MSFFKRNLIQMNFRNRNLQFYNRLCSCLILQILIGTLCHSSMVAGEDRYRNKPIPAAINTRHSLSVKNVDLPSTGPYSPGTIEVKSAMPSFVIKFNSASSKLNLFHEHQSEKVPPPKESFSEDQPHIMRHSVTKPIIQEVHEVISPFRRVVQEIKPVVETIRTVIAKSSNVPFIGKSDNKITTSLLSTTSHSSLSSPSSTSSPLSSSLMKKNFGNVNSKPLSEANYNSEDNENLEPDNQSEPDLVLDESNIIDDTLYNGNSELDLKYASPNGKDMQPIVGNDFEPRLYRDR